VKYTYTLARSAERYFGRLPVNQRNRISHRLEQLCEDPYDASISKQLAARGGQRSSRVGDLRILYFVEDEIRVVDVTDIGTRGQVYRA
jgi:mRNA-degrading endonuclease RelE of RelBE toxin-antitoxin system